MKLKNYVKGKEQFIIILLAVLLLFPLNWFKQVISNNISDAPLIFFNIWAFNTNVGLKNVGYSQNDSLQWVNNPFSIVTLLASVIPYHLTGSLIFSYNLVSFSFLFTSSICVYLLFFWYTRKRSWSLIGTLLFLFSKPVYLETVLGHLDVLFLLPAPLFMLLLEKKSEYLPAIILSLLLVLNQLNPFLMVFVLLFVVYKRPEKKMIFVIGLTVILYTLIIYWFLGAGSSIERSIDKIIFASFNHIYPLLALLVISAFLIAKNKDKNQFFFFACSVLFILISTANPFSRLIASLPIFNSFRAFYRIWIISYFCVTLTLIIGLSKLKNKKLALSILLVSIIPISYFNEPLNMYSQKPVMELKKTDFFQGLEGAVILNYPLHMDWDNISEESINYPSSYHYLVTQHEQSIVNAELIFLPDYLKENYELFYEFKNNPSTQLLNSVRETGVSHISCFNCDSKLLGFLSINTQLIKEQEGLIIYSISGKDYNLGPAYIFKI